MEPYPNKSASKGSITGAAGVLQDLPCVPRLTGLCLSIIVYWLLSFSGGFESWGGAGKGKAWGRREVYKSKRQCGLKSLKSYEKANKRVSGLRCIRWWRANYYTNRTLALGYRHWHLPLSSSTAKGKSFDHTKLQLPHLYNGNNGGTSPHCVVVNIAMIHHKQ